MTALTITEALAQGYEYFLYDTGDKWQLLHSLEENTVDFNRNPVLADKEKIKPTIPSNEDLAEYVAEYIVAQWDDESGSDDTSDLYRSLREVDFSSVLPLLEKAVEDTWYLKATKIKLIPDDENSTAENNS